MVAHFQGVLLSIGDGVIVETKKGEEGPSVPNREKGSLQIPLKRGFMFRETTHLHLADFHSSQDPRMDNVTHSGCGYSQH